MKTSSLIFTSVTVALLSASSLQAQFGSSFGSKIMVESGEVASLKNEKSFNIEYDYSSFGVGKFKTEGEYTKSKVTEYNKKEKGKGDKWLEGWVAARKESYEPMFEELLNKVMDKKGVKYAANKSAKYTLIVKTTFVEPGYNIGISKQPSFVNFDFTWVETANPSNVVVKLYVQNVVGQGASGFDYDVSSRVKESYAKGGKMLGKYLLKEE